MKDQEREIVEKIIRKDEETLRLFYNQYYKQVFNFIYRRTNKYHLSEELAQDTFVDFLEALRDFRYQSSLKTFIFSIAKNKIIDWMRKKKIKKVIFSMLPDYVVESLKIVIMEDEFEKKILTNKIARVFSKLPNDYRDVLRQKYIEEFKVRQIAENLRLGFKATESLIFRARKAFIKIFSSL